MRYIKVVQKFPRLYAREIMCSHFAISLAVFIASAPTNQCICKPVPRLSLILFPMRKGQKRGPGKVVGGSDVKQVCGNVYRHL